MFNTLAKRPGAARRGPRGRVRRRLVAGVLWTLLAAGPTAAQQAGDAPAEAYYLELAPSIVANLNNGPDYVRCDIQLMTLGPERLADIALHAPALRHEIFMELTGVDGSTLTTPAGKEALRQRLLEAIRAVLARATGAPLVEDLYFTSFFVQ